MDQPNIWAVAFVFALAGALWLAAHQLTGKPDRRALPLLKYLKSQGGGVPEDDPELDRYTEEADPAVRSGLISFGGSHGTHCVLTSRGERALRDWS